MCLYKKLVPGHLFVLLMFAAIPAVADVSYQQRLSAGLNLISIGVETNQSPKSLFGDNLIGIWKPDAKKQYFTIPDKLKPGIGYWVVMRDEAVVTISGLEVKKPHVVGAPKGWNSRGNPFHHPLTWQELTVCNGGDCLTMEQARAAGWIGSLYALSEGHWYHPDMINGSLAEGAAFSLEVLVNGASLEFRKVQDWTIMLYLDGDDAAIQSDMIEAFAEIAAKSVGSNEHVNIVAQFDRLPGTPAYGGWSIAHRFFVTPGMEPFEANAVADWGDGSGGREVAMSRPETLSEFINWTASNYPARRYALLIADHGYGWQGMTMDTTSLGDFMTVKELRSVLEKSPVRIDLLALDACLMQMLEVVYELRNCPVGLVVASEAPGRTWPMADLLEVPLTRPKVSSEEFARSICDLYIDSHVETDITMSVFDLAHAGKLTERVKDMAAAIYESECDDSTAYEAVRSRADDVLEEIENAVLYFRNGSDYADARGITVFFPLPSAYGMSDVFLYQYQGETISFAEHALWRSFLFSYYNPMMVGSLFNHCIDPKVYDARSACTVFDEDKSKIDLYDFCRLLIEAP